MVKLINDNCVKAMQQLGERKALKEYIEAAERGDHASKDKLDHVARVCVLQPPSLSCCHHLSMQ